MRIHAPHLPLVAMLALSPWSSGCASDRSPARDKPRVDAIETDAETEETEPADTEPAQREPDRTSNPSDADPPTAEPDADAPPQDPEPGDSPAAMGASSELPLALCEKYFAHTSPLPTFSAATMAFWAEENCAIAGLFGDIEATIDFLNYLRNWSLLILGCEPPHDVAGGLALFGPAWLAGDAPLAQADVDALIEHFMNTLTAELPLDAEDEAHLREALVQVSAGVSRCDCAAQLDRCTDLEPAGAEQGGE